MRREWHWKFQMLFSRKGSVDGCEVQVVPEKPELPLDEPTTTETVPAELTVNPCWRHRTVFLWLLLGEGTVQRVGDKAGPEGELAEEVPVWSMCVSAVSAKEHHLIQSWKGGKVYPLSKGTELLATQWWDGESRQWSTVTDVYIDCRKFQDLGFVVVFSVPKQLWRNVRVQTSHQVLWCRISGVQL